MLNKDAHLTSKIFSADLESRPTRDGFGEGVVEAGKDDERVVVLCADLKESTRAEQFEKAFPERYVEMGVAEQNMATVAAGMALAGKVPFITSYAAFNPGRNYEQIRTTIALAETSVKVCGMHAGVSVGPDGATHQMLEDIGLMRMLPNMAVIAPADAEEARKATIVAAKREGPVYLRFGRSATPVITTEKTPFVFGKALTLYEAEAPTVAIFTTGSLAHTALTAARQLKDLGVSAVVQHHATIKPLDVVALRKVASRVEHVVTLEEHQAAGGFGSLVAEVLSGEAPIKITRLGVHDQFGQSGEPEELLAHYGLDAASVVKAAQGHGS